MDKLEKVIKGLGCLAGEYDMEDNKCAGCGYRDCATFAICIGEIARDALSLLKAQEPRVMTLEELKNNVDNPCWFESHGTYMGYKGFWIIPYAFTAWETMYYVFPLMQINERGDSHYSELGLPAYNKAWRCWTSRPTDEQREAVKWE